MTLVVCGIPSVVYGIPSVVYGIPSVVCGIPSVVYGILSIAHRVIIWNNMSCVRNKDLRCYEIIIRLSQMIKQITALIILILELLV